MASEIQDENELEAVLRDRPVEWSWQVAARAALRVLPVVLVSSAFESQWMSVLRACFVSWAAGKFPTHDMRSAADSAARSAADSTRSAARSAADFAARPAADSASWAVNSARLASDLAARYAAAAAARSAHCAGLSVGSSDASAHSAAYSAAWTAVCSDVTQFNNDRTLRSVLSLQRMWPDQIPGSIAKSWLDFSGSRTATQHGYGPWINWYQALVTGDGPDADYFGTELGPVEIHRLCMTAAAR